MLFVDTHSLCDDLSEPLIEMHCGECLIRKRQESALNSVQICPCLWYTVSTARTLPRASEFTIDKKKGGGGEYSLFKGNLLVGLPLFTIVPPLLHFSYDYSSNDMTTILIKLPD